MKALLATAALLSCLSAQAVTVGIHTFSKHESANYDYDTYDGIAAQRKYNNRNFGLYVIADNGFTAGGYRNSYGVNSFYAGWTWQGPSLGPVSIAATAALATGYESRYGVGKLRPMVMPSLILATPLGVSVRYTAGPAKHGFIQHLSIERKF